MIFIYTFEDLQALGGNELNRANFAFKVVQEHKESPAYKRARDAQKYYDGENPTICKLEKIIYDYLGVAHKNLYTANHKIASQFFGEVVDQEVSYLLRNGITFTKPATTKALGKDIHRRCADILEAACIAGQSFGFWNYDHLECFLFADTNKEPGFAPLYSEKDGSLRAGVRYWQLDDSHPLNIVLYEEDGITEYQRNDKGVTISSTGKRTYKRNRTVQKSTGIVLGETDGGNYSSFPIVPFFYQKNGQSELNGKRNTVDALDLVTSNMVNNVDEGNLIYWVLTNCGGMTEDDDAAFLEQLHISHIVHADGGDGAKAEPHTVETPYESTQQAIEKLERRLYKDFRAFDEGAITAGSQTATAIKASYVPLDAKTDKNEDNMTDFLHAIMAIAGIEDEPTYTRSQILNRSEEVQTVLSGAEYLGDEYVTKKILTLLGDADQFTKIQNAKQAEESDRYKQMEQ